jgi:hypothetical protein
LAIGSDKTVPLFGLGSAEPASNRSAIIEFLVGYVDAAEYERLRGRLDEVVTAPITMSWGSRALLFRDPDGCDHIACGTARGRHSHHSRSRIHARVPGERWDCNRRFQRIWWTRTRAVPECDGVDESFITDIHQCGDPRERAWRAWVPPKMTVSIDGNAISTTTVSATSWTNYTTAATIDAGMHTLSIAFTNALNILFCRRSLFLDNVSLPAAVVTGTLPTGGFAPATAGKTTWSMAFDDEFNDTSLDTTKWVTFWYSATGPRPAGWRG